MRRTRIDGDSWAGPSVAFGEDVEHYVLRVMTGETLVREIETSEPSWTYPAALRLADGAVETIEVAQISQAYGAGPFTRKLMNV